MNYAVYIHQKNGKYELIASIPLTVVAKLYDRKDIEDVDHDCIAVILKPSSPYNGAKLCSK